MTVIGARTSCKLFLIILILIDFNLIMLLLLTLKKSCLFQESGNEDSPVKKEETAPASRELVIQWFYRDPQGDTQGKAFHTLVGCIPPYNIP